MSTDHNPLSPSKVSAWLECRHTLTLQREVDAGQRKRPASGFGPFAELLAEKGVGHEEACLADYATRGIEVVEVPPRNGVDETFGAWADRVAQLLEEGHEVLFQMPLVHDGMRGVADFLERKELPGGDFTYEPVDAKLARSDAKPGHVLQLCFYADAVGAALGHLPEEVHVWLGSGRRDTVRLDEVAPYWRHVRQRLRSSLETPFDDLNTRPLPCSYCQFCDFAGVCEEQWREADELHHVAGLRGVDREHLEAAEVETIASLAERHQTVEGLDDDRLARLQRQAELQVQAREAPEDLAPYELQAADGSPGGGLRMLPQSSPGDVFLDFEGHPFWRPDTGLFFLFGLLVGDGDGGWTYQARWAHDEADELDAARWLVEWIDDRRATWPGMHVYHYNHTERSALERMFHERGLDDSDLAILVREGVFVDLYDVVRNSVQAGVESYGLKHMERLAGFDRGEEIDKGAGAVVAYEQFIQRVPAHERAGRGHDTDDELASIAAYNADDVKATQVLRDWLVDLRPAGLGWREAVLLPEPENEDRDEIVQALDTLGGDGDELLAALLSYWRREERAHAAQARAFAESDVEELRADEEAIVDICDHRLEEDADGKTHLHARFPAQAVAPFDRAIYITTDGPPAYNDDLVVDVARGRIAMPLGEGREHHRPTVLIKNTHVWARPKPARLRVWAEEAVASGGVADLDGARGRLVRRELTRVGGGMASSSAFAGDLDAHIDLVKRLDRSHLAVQGPPGTGKTWRAARMIRGLLLGGRRVGITAFSHAAIHNLVEAVHDAMTESGDRMALRCVVRPSRSGPPIELDGVKYTSGNRTCANDDYNLVAGTTWLFAGKDMQSSPVDVLVVDEAGQLGLADMLAAASSAESLVLTGDPQQLPQVTQATHPAGAGASGLGHLLQDHKTFSADEGIFLSETWRMHPEITEFISTQFYEGRLTSHPSCGRQSTAFGTGLRWIQAEHAGCSTRSDEEVELVARFLHEILGTDWTDQHGVTRPIGRDDVLVVTPYNRQKDALRQRFADDPALRGIRAGTVDKFQGQESAVVVFSAAASTSEDASRGVGFVFDRNRFNVAISRARCIAVLVCSPRLLDATPTSVDAMRTLAAPCDFVQRASRIEPVTMEGTP